MNKNILISLILLLFLSCSLLLPPTHLIFNSPYPRDEVITAIDDFAERWKITFNEDVSYMLSGVNVRFYPKTSEEWTTIGCRRGYTGNYSDYQTIHLAYISDVENFPLENTALWHELTHVLLYFTTNDPDYNHITEPGPWKITHDILIRSLRESYAQGRTKDVSVDLHKMCLSQERSWELPGL